MAADGTGGLPHLPGGGDSSTLLNAKRSTGARRTTARRNGDVQYDFTMTIASATLPAGSDGAYKYQVRWKRGDRITGKTATLHAEGGVASWHYQASFTSTIQRKDPVKLHKKVVGFTLVEYRPREGGKYDKKAWEGHFNLAAVVTSDGLGDPVVEAAHQVPCGKESGIVLSVRCGGVPRDSDADLMTDMPAPTDIGSGRGGGGGGGGAGGGASELEPLTERSLDDGFDDDAPPFGDSAGHLPRGHSTSPSAAPAAMAPLPAAAPPAGGGVPMAEHLKLAQECKALREELELCQKEASMERLAEREDAAAAREAREAESRCKGEEVKAAAQLLAELGLLTHGVLLAPPSLPPGGSAAVVMKALVRWNAFGEVHTPGGRANTFLVNALATLEGAVAALLPHDQVSAARWASTLWHLLLCLSSRWRVSESLNEAVAAYDGGDFAAHLFAALGVPPILSGATAGPPPLLLSPAAAAAAGASVLRNTSLPPQDADADLVLAFNGHVLCSLRAALSALLRNAVEVLEGTAWEVVDCRDGGDEKVLAVVQEAHKQLLMCDAPQALSAAVLRQLFTQVDGLLFFAMVREPERCRDETALRYKESCSKYERWMRDARVFNDPGCRAALRRTRQACDLLLLRGGTVCDAALWDAVPCEHLHTLVANVDRCTPGAVAAEVLEQALALSRGSGGGGAGGSAAVQAPPARCTLLPKLPESAGAADEAWAKLPLPAALRPPLYTALGGESPAGSEGEAGG